jgi:hypothetical protein
MKILFWKYPNDQPYEKHHLTDEQRSWQKRICLWCGGLSSGG